VAFSQEKTSGAIWAMLLLVKCPLTLSVSSGSSSVEAEWKTAEQVATEEKKHWPGKVFKGVIFSAISLSWCVASGLTGPALGEHKLEQGLSLSSPLILTHHLHPERFMGSRIKKSQRRTDGMRREDRREFRRFRMTGNRNRICGVYSRLQMLADKPRKEHLSESTLIAEDK